MSGRELPLRPPSLITGVGPIATTLGMGQRWDFGCSRGSYCVRDPLPEVVSKAESAESAFAQIYFFVSDFIEIRIRFD